MDGVNVYWRERRFDNMANGKTIHAKNDLNIFFWLLIAID